MQTIWQHSKVDLSMVKGLKRLLMNSSCQLYKQKVLVLHCIILINVRHEQ